MNSPKHHVVFIDGICIMQLAIETSNPIGRKKTVFIFNA